MVTRKNLKNLQTNLASLAATLPTQRAPAPEAPTTPARVRENKAKRDERESEVQFSFSMPASVRKALAIKAVEADMTMRGFILSALREQGIDVADEVISDARRKD